MERVRERGRRRLVAATAGVGLVAAAVATTVGATRPTPRHEPVRHSTPRPAAPQLGVPPVDAGKAPPDSTSSGS